MKKTILLAAGLLLAISVNAQKKKGGAKPAFDVGSNTIGIGIGFGNTYTYSYYGYSTTYQPAFSAYFDHGIIGQVGPGTIGIGGVIGIQSSYAKYNSGEKATWTNFIIAARGTYHLTILKDKNNKFDPYGGVMLGLRSETYKNDYPGAPSESYGGVHPTVGAFVGAKYNFVPVFGVWSELGYDVSFFRLGVNFNF